MRTGPRLAVVVAGVIAGVAFALLLVLAVSRIAFPYDLGQYEASTWAPAELLIAGHNPYAIWRTLEPPYVMAPYGPAFYALVGAGLQVVGHQLWFGRFVASVACAASALCLWVLVRRFRGASHACLAILAFAAGLPVQAWLGVHRPDAVALACGLCAVVVITRPSRPVASAVLAAGLAALALFFRQTTVVPALVVGAWTVLVPPRGRAVPFAIAFVLFFGLPAALLEATAPGGYLWQQYRLAASVDLSADQLVVMGRAFAGHLGTWVVLGAGVAGLVRNRGRRDGAETGAPARRFTGVCIAALVASSGVALITSLRLGSNVNYWLEASAWLALAMGMLARLPVGRGDSRALTAAVLAATIAVDAAIALRVERARWSELPYLEELVATLATVGDAGECIVAIYPELAASAGRPAYFNDGIQYDGRAPLQHAALRRALTERRCAGLILPFPETLKGYTRVELRTPPGTILPAYLFRRTAAD